MLIGQLKISLLRFPGRDPDGIASTHSHGGGGGNPQGWTCGAREPFHIYKAHLCDCP